MTGIVFEAIQMLNSRPGPLGRRIAQSVSMLSNEREPRGNGFPRFSAILIDLDSGHFTPVVEPHHRSPIIIDSHFTKFIRLHRQLSGPLWPPWAQCLSLPGHFELRTVLADIWNCHLRIPAQVGTQTTQFQIIVFENAFGCQRTF
jgi:hypothetical protein